MSVFRKSREPFNAISSFFNRKKERLWKPVDMTNKWSLTKDDKSKKIEVTKED